VREGRDTRRRVSEVKPERERRDQTLAVDDLPNINYVRPSCHTWAILIAGKKIWVCFYRLNQSSLVC